MDQYRAFREGPAKRIGRRTGLQRDQVLQIQAARGGRSKAVVLGRGRYVLVVCQPLHLAFALIVHEEEGAVVPVIEMWINGPAERTTELVEAELRLAGGGKVVRGIEVVVAQELPQIAM